MPNFAYKALDVTGATISGNISASTKLEAEQTVQKNRLRLISIEQQEALADKLLAFTNKVSLKDRAMFARQMATMISAGVPIVQSLLIIEKQITNKKFQEALHEMVRDVEGGHSFSDALGRQDKIFDRIFISLVKAGESSGQLDLILLAMADRLENDTNFQARVKGAMAYPAVILVVMVIMGAYVTVKIIPQLMPLFEGSGTSLPISTKFLIWLSDVLTHQWYFVILALIAFAFAVRALIKTAAGQMAYAKFMIRGPIIGSLMQGAAMTSFLKTFSLLIKSGVPIVDAIKLTAESVGNKVYQQSLLGTVAKLERGIPLSGPLSQDKDFPVLVSQMILVGEQTGKMDEVLNTLGKFYAEQTDTKVKAFASLIEPVIIVIMGAGVVFLLFSILGPIFAATQNMGS